MFIVELLGKIIYQCKKGLLEILLLGIFWKTFKLVGLERFFNSAHCIKDLEYWSCANEFFYIVKIII